MSFLKRNGYIEQAVVPAVGRSGEIVHETVELIAAHDVALTI